MEKGISNRFYFLAIGLLLCFNFVAWLAIFHLISAPALKAVFFDIGQGDSAFIEIGGRYQILIDGGPGRKVLEKLAQEMPFWDKTIDMVVLSHSEKDHLEGLIFVLESYKVNKVVSTGAINDTETFKAWEKALEKEVKEGASVETVSSGESISLSSFPLANLIVIYPFESISGQEPKNTNQTSLVAKLEVGDFCFLFPGDIYQKQEKELVLAKANLNCDILKIAHHGSKTSTSQEFLQAVSPQASVVSLSSTNSYGHPHAETLETLELFNIPLLRTDQLGDITIKSIGQNLIIQ